MDELKEFFSRIKLVRMRTPNMAKIAIILVIVLCMGALIGLRLAITDLTDRTEDLKNDAAHLIGENEEMDEKIDQVGSIQTGKYADFVITNADYSQKRVFMGGKEI